MPFYLGMEVGKPSQNGKGDTKKKEKAQSVKGRILKL